MLGLDSNTWSLIWQNYLQLWHGDPKCTKKQCICIRGRRCFTCCFALNSQFRILVLYCTCVGEAFPQTVHVSGRTWPWYSAQGNWGWPACMCHALFFSRCSLFSHQKKQVEKEESNSCWTTQMQLAGVCCLDSQWVKWVYYLPRRNLDPWPPCWYR